MPIQNRVSDNSLHVTLTFETHTPQLAHFTSRLRLALSLRHDKTPHRTY